MTTRFGARIQEILKCVGGTQADFAKRLNINLSSLRNYMMGRSKPDAGVIETLCEEFGVSPDWLILGVGEMFFREEDMPSKATLEERHATLESVRSLSPKRRETLRLWLCRMESLQSADKIEAASRAFTQGRIDAEKFTAGLQEVEEMELDYLVVAAIRCKIDFLKKFRKNSHPEKPIFGDRARDHINTALESEEEASMCSKIMLAEIVSRWALLSRV